MALTHFFATATNKETGKPLDGVIVELLSGSTVQTIYSDRNLTPKTQMVTGLGYDPVTGVNLYPDQGPGEANCYVEEGNYDIRYTYNGSVIDIQPDFPVFGAVADDFAGEAFTYTEALTRSFDASVDSFVTTGRVTAGDGGSARYLRWVTGMAALTSGQEGYSWFEDATGSQWVLAPGQDFYIAQFGGIGGSGLDAGTIINKALDAPMVKVLRTGNLEHYFSGDIVKPSGKWLISNLGEGWLKAIPVTSEGAANRIGIYCEDDNNGGFYGLRVDVQRSGIGLTGKRCNGIVVRGSPVNVQVLHCDVYNATGYAHYTSVEAGGTGSVVRDKCRAFNSQVSFECGSNQTGSTVETRIDCEAHSGTASVFDGGAVIDNEAHYHEYGLIAKVLNIRCKARGVSGAPCFPVTVLSNIGEVGYLDCDIETTSAVPALSAIGQDGFTIANVWIKGGRFVSPAGIGASFTNATGSVDRAYVQGASGCLVSTGATVDFYAPNIQADTSSGGTVAATALDVQGTGVARWHGAGSLAMFSPRCAVQVPCWR